MTDDNQESDSDIGDAAEFVDAVDLEAHPLTAARLNKLRSTVAAGVEAYPVGFERSHTTAEVKARHPDLAPGSSTDDIVTVAGRVMLRRSFGKLLFLTIEDFSGRIQLFVAKNELSDQVFDEIEQTDVGDWVGASGAVMTTRNGELSVKVDGFVALAKSLRPLPDKWHGLSDIETRSRNRHVDLIVNEDSRRIAIARSAIISELRRQFENRGFVEVETPILLGEAGGALARPFVTHHKALGMDMFLRIATELHLKRLVIGGIEKVFEIGRIFRNEGIDSTHNPEFTMLESYEAFADYEDVMVLVEEVFSALATHIHGSVEVPHQGATINLMPPYRRAPMIDLVNEHVDNELTYDTPLAELRAAANRVGATVEDGFGAGRLIAEIFGAGAEQHLTQPTFVTEHPIETSPLARRHRAKANVTERFELFIGGSEYANGYSELNDPLDQRTRFEAQSAARDRGEEETHPIDEDFIRALEYGMPPTGGLGIGVDRLVMLLTDQTHIREVILFPTMRPI